jgi:putative MFS transporter
LSTIHFPRPFAFWSGTVAVILGVLAHVPDFVAAGDMHYMLNGMRMSPLMIGGMLLIVVGFVLATWGLLPAPVSAEARRAASRYDVRVIDDAALTPTHWGLMFVLAIALVIDTMKPATLGFVLPGMTAEYGIPTSRGAWLLLSALTGTTAGSVFWGVMADRVGRRAAILLAALMFIGTSICGTMPLFGANLLMCFLMGVAAGGMLPIVYALMAESVPSARRGFLVVLHGGFGTVGGTLAAAGCAALLEPVFSWRVLWLLNLPTGIIMLVLNRWIPESPRYLLEQGRIEEARVVLRDYGVIVEESRAEIPNPKTQIPNPNNDLRKSGSLGFLGFGIWDLGFGIWPEIPALFRRPVLAQTLVVIAYGVAWGAINWGFIAFLPTFLRAAGFGAGAASYLLFLSSLVAIPATVLVAYAYGRWSSRKSMVAFAVASIAAVLGLAWYMVVPAGGASGVACAEGCDRATIVGLLALLYGATGGVIAMLSPYTAEVYPTRYRGTGSGVSAGSSKLGGLIAGIGSVTGLLAVSGDIVRPAVIVSIPMAAAAVIVAVRGLETRGRRLEELASR